MQNFVSKELCQQKNEQLVKSIDNLEKKMIDIQKTLSSFVTKSIFTWIVSGLSQILIGVLVFSSSNLQNQVDKNRQEIESAQIEIKNDLKEVRRETLENIKELRKEFQIVAKDVNDIKVKFANAIIE